MIRVYLDPGVLRIRPDADRVDTTSVASDAGEVLRTLEETGHELVLLTPRPVGLPDGFPPVRSTARLDEDTREAWYLTSDPELCGRRRPGLRTVLVGPGPAGRRSSIQRCDLTTRDLRAATLEILAQEAMAAAR